MIVRDFSLGLDFSRNVWQRLKNTELEYVPCEDVSVAVTIMFRGIKSVKFDVRTREKEGWKRKWETIERKRERKNEWKKIKWGKKWRGQSTCVSEDDKFQE